MSKSDRFEIDGEWVVLALLTVFVPPLGVILILNKLRKSKVKPKDTRTMGRLGTSVLVAGIIMALFGSRASFLPLLVGGGVLGGSYFMRKREKRYARIAAVLAGRNAMFISNLAATLGMPEAQVEDDLKHMLDEGCFSNEAYIDVQSRRIVLWREGANDYSGFQEAQAHAQSSRVSEQEKEWKAKSYNRNLKGEPVHAAANQAAENPPQAEAPKEEIKKEKTTFDNSEYEKIVRQIRELNDRIADESISEKIDRIEDLTRRIFTLVEQKPAMRPQINKFMNYYLPTTLKLLDSYALLEAQGIEGDNITASKQEIERTMDLLVAGFEKQLDMLFKSQAMDITSDVAVLEGMMAQDGLGENKYVMQTGGKH